MNTAESNHGSLIVNADDWGDSRKITDAIWECVKQKTVSSASAMVFMEDSERAAELARLHGIDVGLHLNLTTLFKANQCAPKLVEEQRKTARYLRSSRIAQAVLNPMLSGAFDYVVKAQLEEFERLYGESVHRIDGHHHMHLCENVLFTRLLPARTIARRNFTFRPGEKSVLNRMYRRWQDRRLARRHRIADYFVALIPLDLRRLHDFTSLALYHTVEVETHPDLDDEFRFLISGGLTKHIGSCEVAADYSLPDK